MAAFVATKDGLHKLRTLGYLGGGPAGEQQEAVITELIARLQAVTDIDGKQVIRGVYRSDRLYQGDATALAPELIVGYARGYRAS